MSMWDLTSDDGRTTAHEHAETPDEKAMCWPQAYSTMLGVHGKESGYSTKENGGIDSVVEVDLRVPEKTWNGDGNLESDRNVVERRQPKLTEKFKLKREIQSRIANIGALMGLDKNLELVGEESVKLNECFKEFGDLHEEIQELLTEEEQIPDTQVYDNLHTEVKLVRETVQKWMTDAGRRINEERKSTKSSDKTRSSKASHASSNSSRARALQAKAKQAE